MSRSQFIIFDDQNAVCLPLVPKFQFFLGITVVQREIEDNGYVKFWRINKVQHGLRENDEFPGVLCKVAFTKKEAGIETGGLKWAQRQRSFTVS